LARDWHESSFLSMMYPSIDDLFQLIRILITPMTPRELGTRRSANVGRFAVTMLVSFVVSTIVKQNQARSTIDYDDGSRSKIPENDRGLVIILTKKTRCSPLRKSDIRHEGPLLPLLQFYPAACCNPLSTAYELTGASS